MHVCNLQSELVRFSKVSNGVGSKTECVCVCVFTYLSEHVNMLKWSTSQADTHKQDDAASHSQQRCCIEDTLRRMTVLSLDVRQTVCLWFSCLPKTLQHTYADKVNDGKRLPIHLFFLGRKLDKNLGINTRRSNILEFQWIKSCYHIGDLTTEIQKENC